MKACHRPWMSIACVGVLALVLCGLLGRDLLAQGIYRLESAEVGRCRLAATAEVKDGKFLVEGRLSRGRFPYPLTAEAEVSFVDAGGSAFETTRVRLRRSRNRRGSGTFAYCTAEFEQAPPAGTLIRVRSAGPAGQDIPGCAKPAGG